MPWLNRIPNDDRHICKPPHADAGGIGSKWECEDCRAVWMIAQEFMGERRRWKFMYYEIPPVSSVRALRKASSALVAPPYLMD